jgi:diguanylate cyclase (GGDEF)-like protein/PAS domain S-box-containing protein
MTNSKSFNSGDTGRAPSIRMSLAKLVVGCVLPLAGISAFLIFNFYEHEQAQLTRQAINRARLMVTAVDRGFAGTQASLLALGTSLRSEDLQGFYLRAFEALQNMHADSIVVIDTNGQLLLATNRRFGAPLPKLTSSPLLKRVLETERPGVSDLYMGPIVSRPIFAVGVPVEHGGKIKYLLTATAAPSQLTKILTEQNFPDSWRAVLTDSTGTIIARTHDITKFLGKKGQTGLLQRMKLADEGSYQGKTLDGIPVLTVYSRSTVSGWMIAIGMPLEELNGGLRSTLAWLIAATCTALAIGLALAWILGGRIAQSVRALVAPAKALGSGEMVTIASKIHLKEADEVAKALVQTAQVLRQHAQLLQETHECMRESEEHHRTLVEWSPEAIIVHRNGEMLFLNPAANKLLGATPEHGLKNKSIIELAHPDFKAIMLKRSCSHDSEHGTALPKIEVKFINLDGKTIDVEVHGTVIVYDGLPAIHASMRDITERKQAQEVQRWSSMLFANIQDGAAVTDRDGAILAINPAFTAINGYTEAEILGRNMRVLHSGRQDAAFYTQMWQTIRASGSWQGEIWNRRKNGEIYLERLTVNAVYDMDGEVTNYVGTSVDLTSLKHADKMEHLAHHDALTGLPNRLQLMSRLEHAIEVSRRQHIPGAVLFLDLDRFKAVNDTWGHPAGDDLLQQVAQRLGGRMRAMDTLARLGGDEFVAVLEDVEGPDNAAKVAGEFVRLLNQPFILAGGQEACIGGSVGIAMFPMDGDSAEMLLRHADAALYRAKEAGRNTYRFHAG